MYGSKKNVQILYYDRWHTSLIIDYIHIKHFGSIWDQTIDMRISSKIFDQQVMEWPQKILLHLFDLIKYIVTCH